MHPSPPNVATSFMYVVPVGLGVPNDDDEEEAVIDIPSSPGAPVTLDGAVTDCAIIVCRVTSMDLNMVMVIILYMTNESDTYYIEINNLTEVL